ncbi:MAG: SGNH/GDSL hydrolase family protein [Candidatus Binatus sp.]|uniref:SGNH/GDSL hydrolase family protein n=1 Tax=Candidatus Binatus sp. TaxID=2811406 RepID=UPI002718618E|nr:SGNH/GDSL hydrolase family protein [Candidatus Binatus sp.]MDO8431621.1 SGNH/GDSL hydrolase family protein [Candidatus Binatus sp.]
MGAPSANDSIVMLALGDSVMWGQGHLPHNKFHQLVCDQLRYQDDYQGITPVMRAHSGAIIGARTDRQWTAKNGEIPISGPSILTQCRQYDDDPDAVRVVLLDGGINDVTVGKIIDPSTSSTELRELIDDFCYTDMLQLLGEVAAKFSNPKCRIILTGYYQILSRRSDLTNAIRYLVTRGVANAVSLLASTRGLSDATDNCRQFHLESDQAYANAVAEANKTAGGRITFVASGFTDADALFQHDSLLWGLTNLQPQDPLEDYRDEVCPNFFRDSQLDCLKCRFASVGHPNGSGAIKFYQAIMNVFP